MRILLVVALIVASLLVQATDSASMAGPAPIIVQGFQTPESVLYDLRADVYLVSNINGPEVPRNVFAVDGNGFISKVSPNGKVLALKWIDGTRNGVTLNGPKGMAILDDTLYVTDITAVRRFDRSTGRFKGSIDIPGATLVNDVAAGRDGSVYVSDTGLKPPDFSPSGTDAVYRIDRTGAVTPLAKSAELNHPNGITVRADGSVMVLNHKGEIYALSRDGKRSTVARLPGAILDGIEILPDGSLLVSGWDTSSVYIFARDGAVKVAVANVKSPADIGYDRKRDRVLIPLFMENKVHIQALK